jgi:hypothetical protein
VPNSAAILNLKFRITAVKQARFSGKQKQNHPLFKFVAATMDVINGMMIIYTGAQKLCM